MWPLCVGISQLQHGGLLHLHFSLKIDPVIIYLAGARHPLLCAQRIELCFSTSFTPPSPPSPPPTPPLLLPPISKTMLFSPSLHFLFLNLQFPEKLIQNHTAFPKQNAVFRRRHRVSVNPSFINPPLNSGCGPQRTDMSLNPSSPRLTRPVWPICLFCRWIKPRPAGPWSTAEVK